MVSGDTREVVVIKNINSNIIEEAILILKSEHAEGDSKVPAQKQGQVKDRDFILKEAQIIIDSYIKEHKIHRKPVRGKGFTIKLFKKEFSLNRIINIALILSILSLIFIISRLI